VPDFAGFVGATPEAGGPDEGSEMTINLGDRVKVFAANTPGNIKSNMEPTAAFGTSRT
jgi:hypothetical protein